MLVYTDLLSGDELLSDSFPYKEIENGMAWEVVDKWGVQGGIDGEKAGRTRGGLG
ncbi:hypothetical protein, partial [Escherichia coli]|uniref:hypothetical protein n=1 Tax=Escherichia coli TaxID=562 RepID=UPI0034D63AAB